MRVISLRPLIAIQWDGTDDTLAKIDDLACRHGVDFDYDHDGTSLRKIYTQPDHRRERAEIGHWIVVGPGWLDCVDGHELTERYRHLDDEE